MISAAAKTYATPEQMKITGKFKNEFADVLTEEACSFLLSLHQRFNDKRKDLLRLRERRQTDLDNGKMPGFLPETKSIREEQHRTRTSAILCPSRAPLKA